MGFQGSSCRHRGSGHGEAGRAARRILGCRLPQRVCVHNAVQALCALGGLRAAVAAIKGAGKVRLVVPRAASSGVGSPSGSVSMTPCRHSARHEVLGQQWAVLEAGGQGGAGLSACRTTARASPAHAMQAL